MCDENSRVLIIGNKNDISVYRALSQRGVSDYLVPPLDTIEIQEVIARICKDPSEQELGLTIAFMGANGGVGSSTIAHNTSWAMSEYLKEDVALLDLDIPFGTASFEQNRF